MNAFTMAYQTDTIDVYWICITYLIYLLQVATDLTLHFQFQTIVPLRNDG